MSVPELLTPAEWSALDGVTVMDPDGWRGTRTLPAKSFDEPISRAEWEQRLSVSSQISPVTRTVASEAFSVVDRIAIRLFAFRSTRDVPMAQKWWAVALDEEDREGWRRHARELLADIALGHDDMPATTEYETRHEAYGSHGPFDDIGDAVDFADHVWPGSKVFQRTRVAVRSEWTEVTA